MAGDDETSAGTLPHTGSFGDSLGIPSVALPVHVGDLLGDRYELRRELGRGAHGTVFEAFDRDGAGLVALKMLRHLQPHQRLRFKAEFRALTDVSHPNLVSLHELFASEAQAYFSMELVQGVDLMRWVRRNGRLDEGRLRDALVQLSQGLLALHGLGKLHRDLKPSNVLVRVRDGRVKLVDFGLVREAASVGEAAAIEGTPQYMSPEQAGGKAGCPASDWYSVGVMLYEALQGAPPYPGLSGVSLLIAKQTIPVPSLPRAGVPDDLHALCAALLARMPAARPDGDGVLRCLGQVPSARALGTEPTFVGRRQQLRLLASVLPRLRSEQVAVALVRGPAGSGKSALIGKFASELRARGEFVTVRARCYERESVPHKGVDALVDAIHHALGRDASVRIAIDRDSMGQIRGAAALVALFPVLADVVPSTHGEAYAEDPVERRREAVIALRGLLDRVAGESTLAIVIEDLQWCDHDSAQLLDALLRLRGERPTLFIGTFRDEHVQPDGALAQLLDRLAVFDPVHVDVGALEVDQLVELAGTLLRGRDDAASLAQAIAQQSAGNPLFALELARAMADGSAMTSRAPRLEDVILQRVRQLPAVPRRLLEAVALAGQPIALGVALEAADAMGPDLDALALLRGRSLLRTHGTRLVDPVEVFHDRIGEIVAAAIAVDDARRQHGRLAAALVRRGGDLESIAFHLERAGRTETAAERYAEAGAAAAGALAFHRAAELFAAALRLTPAGHPRRVAWLEARADALADGGRAAEAGRAYLDAMRLSAAEHELALRRRAAEQLLRSGHMAEGLPHLSTVLRRLGLRPPGSPLRSMLVLVAGRAQVHRRGLEVQERSAEAIGTRELARIDACWAAATGLVQASVIVGQDFQTRHLLLALRAGEPHRVARALAVEALYSATAGDAGAAATRALLQEVWSLAKRIDDPHALALSRLAEGAAELYRGRFLPALPLLTEAEAIFRTRCTDVAWELSMSRAFRTMTLWYLGEIEPMLEGLEHALSDAAAREDFHTSLMLRTSYGPLARLVRGELAGARDELAACRKELSGHMRESTFRYVSVLTATRIERYADDGRAAWAVVDREHTGVWRTLMLWRPPFRTFYEHDRGTAALAAAAMERGRVRRKRLKVARASVDALMRQGWVWSTAFAGPMHAALLAADGDARAAAARLARAIEDFDALDMRLYAIACRRRLAELKNDRARCIAADDEMRARGVAEPANMTALLTPSVTGW